MAYGKIKVDTLTWDDSGSDTDVTISTIPNLSTANTVTGVTTIQNDVNLDGATAGRDIVFDRSENALEFADNAKAIFGTGLDLELYHDATDTQIKSTNGKIVITTTAGNSDIEVTPHGSGNVKLDGLAWPNADGSAGHFLKTDGSGALSFAAVDVSPAGSNTQVQFNNSGSYGGSSGLVFNNSTNVLTATNIHDSAGDVRKVPFGQAFSSGTPALAIADANRYVETSVAVIVPQGVFNKGNVITIINTSASAIQITQGGNVTLTFANDGTTGNRSLGAGGIATVIYRTDSGTSPALATISGSGLS
tara:strand:- start:2990 stop:3904 length:915 start_codon:yes stop_codon:yes gene_type:complete